MLYLKGMSATSGIMTFSKHKRKPQEKIMKRAVNGVIQVKKISAPRKLVFVII